ncbi:MAG: signal peptide peptidase SppA [Bacteroidales bacterium]|nr:signal peptide peptidase SppA [Bacteroidales bacterium]
MKDFWKMLLAVICGLLIMSLLTFMFIASMIGAASAGSGSKTVLPREGVLDIDMSKIVLAEQSSEGNISSFSPMSFSKEGQPSIVGLHDAIEALKTAADDPSVKYILLRADGLSSGTATLQEFRGALAAFRSSGKPVIAYTESPSTGSYYLDSVADKVFMTADHGSNAMLLGLSGRLIFLKDLLDKLGVNVQLIRHGKYKSAGEMYIRSSASPENLEQNQVMVSSIWKSFASEICESRGISEEKLNSLIDNLELNFPEDFEKAGLVDALYVRDSLLAKLCDLAVVSDVKDLHLIPFADYVSVKTAAVKTAGRDEIAIIYADGNIIDGNSTDNVAGDRFARVIEKVRKEDKVKAVVLRVNSPGGSVLASSKIKDALDALGKEKPLVASYGDYAASGGYWISNGCEKIFSNPSTLTGSIGVFGMIPDFSKTAKNVAHVGVTAVNSHAHSDMFSLTRPFDKAEFDYMQASIEDIYTRFITLVAEGRKLPVERVDEIAQGRVWTGADALEIGLVDEIGTLNDAIAYAASLAGFEEGAYAVAAYPKPLTMMEQIMKMIGQKSEPDELSILSGTPFASVAPAVRDVLESRPARVMARMDFDIEIR